MARLKSATRDGALSTFLLEVAFDRARMKKRFAAALLEQRAERGGGDPRRFPQPEMAALLGVGLRQYQRWEDPEDPSLPYWRNLEQIAEELNVDVAEIVGSDQQPVSVDDIPDDPEAPEADRLGRLEVEVREMRLLLEEVLKILRRRGVPPKAAAGSS